MQGLSWITTLRVSVRFLRERAVCYHRILFFSFSRALSTTYWAFTFTRKYCAQGNIPNLSLTQKVPFKVRACLVNCKRLAYFMSLFFFCFFFLDCRKCFFNIFSFKHIFICRPRGIYIYIYIIYIYLSLKPSCYFVSDGVTYPKALRFRNTCLKNQEW